MRKTFISSALSGLAFIPSIALAADTPSGALVINDPAQSWNELWGHVLVDLFVIGGVFALITIYFLFAYKRKIDGQEGAMPKMSRETALAWAIIPTFIFLADDFYLAANGWKLWNDQRNPPAGALEVQLTGQMYSWDFNYGGGVTSDTDEQGRPILIVPQGKPVVLRMRSEDVIHSFFIPDFRIKEDMMPGRVTYLWFYPKTVGEHVFTCAEYCGMGHSTMWGKVKVVPPAEFEEFLKSKAPPPPSAPEPQPAGGAS